MTKKRNKRRTPKIPKGRPWWVTMTPLSDSERTAISLDTFSALAEIEENRATDTHLATVAGTLRIAQELAHKAEQEEQIKQTLEDGRQAFWRIVRRWELGNTQAPEDLKILREALTVADDLNGVLERYEVLYAIDKVLHDGLNGFDEK